MPNQSEKIVQNTVIRGDVFNAQCPSRSVLDDITSRWGSLILVILLEKKHRFSELNRRIGWISEKMLAQSLKALESDGFIFRKVYPTIPPSVEYSLTPSGVEVAERIKALTSWVEEHVEEILKIRKQYFLKNKRKT